MVGIPLCIPLIILPEVHFFFPLRRHFHCSLFTNKSLLITWTRMVPFTKPLTAFPVPRHNGVAPVPETRRVALPAPWEEMVGTVWPRSPFILQTSASWRGGGEGLDMGRRLHFKCYVSKCKYATYVCQQIRSRHLIFKKRRRRPAALWRNVGQNV